MSQPLSAPSSRKSRRGPVLGTLIVLLLLAGVIWGTWWALTLRFIEQTDDAYIAGNLLRVMPQVSGRVVAVLADDNDPVIAGQPLIRLDDVDAALAFDRSLVELATTVRAACRLQAQLRESEAVINMRQVDLRQTTDNLARREVLGRRNAIGVEELHNARNSVETAGAALAVAREQHNALAAQLLDTPLEALPAVRQAAAAARERWLALQRTTVRSPADGQIAKRITQAGEVVSTGVPLMTVAALGHLWVDANFKEGQLTRMRVGQPALVTVDMYGTTVTYHGRVAGFAAGTGSTFSLLPPQNATGNWIKIVQRVPVRIEIDQTELAANPLLIGLSTLVKVDVSVTDGPLLTMTQRTGDLPGNLHIRNHETDFSDVETLIRRTITDNLRIAALAQTREQP